jgi:NCS1 family nucleobase:cation symporter-1
MVVASNPVVAGIDLAALLPRWFTIRRGGYFTIAFAFIMQPCQLYNSATNFLTVVGSFNVFLGPFMGIIFADYFLIRKRTMKFTDLFDESPTMLYWYTRGWNWRAVIAWAMGEWPLMPGLVQRGMAPAEFWPGWTRLYRFCWFLGCIVSGAMYLLLDHIWPMPGKKCVDHVDFFGTFGDVKVLSGVEDRLAGALAEKVRIRGSTEKDLEAHSYPIEP